MVTCPFCQFSNEDGALFCEQCKSDLAVEPALPTAQPVMAETAQFVPMVEAAPVGYPMTDGTAAEMIPMAEPLSGAPPDAVPIFDPVVLNETLPPSAVAEHVTIEAAPPTIEIPSPEPALAPMLLAPGSPIAADAQLKLVVLRGLKLNAEYPIYAGLNFIGRTDEKPVDVDLEDQEPPDRVWSSRQHACITFENGMLEIEDLNSANGTFVNRARVYPGQKRPLNLNDVIQIGTVQMRVKG